MTAPRSRNSPSGPTLRPSDNQSLAFSQLRTSLIKVLRNSPESREPICDALELIEALQQQVEAKRHPDRPDAASTVEPRRERKETPAQEYVIQRTAEGDFITERRGGGSQPF